MFVNNVSDKGLVNRIHKGHLQVKNEKDNPI